MILYIFIAHQGSIDTQSKRIQKMCYDLRIDDYIIIKGGCIKDLYNPKNKILSLNCNDSYLGLPEKIMKTFHYLVNNEKYTHFVKLDEDMIINKPIDYDLIKNIDYCGPVVRKGINSRTYHIGRDETWIGNLEYGGDFKDYAGGGHGYVVSRKAILKIVPNFEYYQHFYEDLYIGTLFEKNGFLVKEIKELIKFFKSPVHI